ncbi:MAG TPA: hypothetical protein VEX86_11625 [Longimicrobium sp.]|nr:hypothetical protein [Longimicrobium sp.]
MSRIPSITLVPRDECLRANRYLAHAVVGWQRASAPVPGETRWYEEVCDPVKPDPAIRWAESFILYLPARDLDETARELGPALGRMLAPLGGRTLTLLHAMRTGRWPTPREDPAVLADAARDFRAMGAGESFDGGIRVDAADPADVAAVLAPLLWGVRMDMGYGFVYIAPDGVPFLASLCQYANLHVDVYSKDVAAAIRTAARAAGFEEWNDGMCDERFADGGAIEGRGLRMGDE